MIDAPGVSSRTRRRSELRDVRQARGLGLRASGPGTLRVSRQEAVFSQRARRPLQQSTRQGSAALLSRRTCLRMRAKEACDLGGDLEAEPRVDRSPLRCCVEARLSRT